MRLHLNKYTYIILLLISAHSSITVENTTKNTLEPDLKNKIKQGFASAGDALSQASFPVVGELLSRIIAHERVAKYLPSGIEIEILPRFEGAGLVDLINQTGDKLQLSDTQIKAGTFVLYKGKQIARANKELKAKLTEDKRKKLCEEHKFNPHQLTPKQQDRVEKELQQWLASDEFENKYKEMRDRWISCYLKGSLLAEGANKMISDIHILSQSLQEIVQQSHAKKASSTEASKSPSSWNKYDIGAAVNIPTPFGINIHGQATFNPSTHKKKYSGTLSSAIPIISDYMPTSGQISLKSRGDRKPQLEASFTSTVWHNELLRVALEGSVQLEQDEGKIKKRRSKLGFRFYAGQ